MANDMFGNQFTDEELNNQFRQSYLDAGKHYTVDTGKFAGAGYVPQTDSNRSALNRLLDVILVGQHTVQGAIHGAIDPNQSVLGGVWEGLKASNPFGAGNKEGEYTFSQNMGAMGWNPTSTVGKVAKGVAGFVGDVALDPLTYLSLGGTAVLKGTGEAVGKKVVERFTPDMAEAVLKKTTGAMPEASAVEDLARRINKARGLVEPGTGRGIGFYGDTIPFGKKLGLAGKQAELVSADSLRKFGDATFAPFVNKAGDLLQHSTVGKLFSTKAELLDTARKDPEGLAMMFDFARKAGENKFTQKEATTQLKEEYLGFKKLDKESQVKITNMLEDKSLWNKMTTYKPLIATQAGADLHGVAEQFVKDYGMQDEKLAGIMKEVTPKFKPGEAVTMKFNGVEDTNAVIEGMQVGNGGQRFYKVQGRDHLIPESNFVKTSDVIKEKNATAMKDHLATQKASVDAGDSGRINLSDSAIGIDSKTGLSHSTPIDNAIKSGEITPIDQIAVTKASIDPMRETNISNYKSAIEESKTSKATLDKAKADLVEAEKLPYAQNRTKIDALNQTIKNERKNAQLIGQKLDLASRKLPSDWKATDNIAKSEVAVDSSKIPQPIKTNLVDASGKDAKLVNQFDVRAQTTNDLRKATNSINAHNDKTFLSENIQISKDGKIVDKSGAVLGHSISGGKMLNNSSPLNTLMNIKGLGKKSWTVRKEMGNAEIKAYFNNLVEKDPVVKDMFSSFKSTGKMSDTSSVKNMTDFIDSYYTKPASDLVNNLHKFNKDYNDVIPILDREFGDYATLIKRSKIDRAEYIKKAGVDGSNVANAGLPPLEKGYMAKRMQRMYELYNNPKELEALKAETLNANSGVLNGKIGSDEMKNSFDKANKDMSQSGADRFAQQQKEAGIHGYANADQSAIDKAVETTKYTMKDIDGTYLGTTRATQWTKDGVPTHIMYNYEGKQVEMSTLQLDQKGISLTESLSPSVSGTKFVPKVSAMPSAQSVGNDVAALYEKQALNAKIDSKVADIFKTDAESTVHNIANEPIPTEFAKTNAEKQIAKETVLQDKTVQEAVNDMIDEITPPKADAIPRRTVEDALHDLPKDINDLIASGKAQKADAEIMVKKLSDYRKALSSEAEFETYAKTLWGDTKYADLMEKRATTTFGIDNLDLGDKELVDVAKGIRENFKSVAVMEKAIGKLDSSIMEGYVTHVINPAFKSPLEEFTEEQLADMGMKIPKNSFNAERKYSIGSVMPNGDVLKEGTIKEINGSYEKFANDLNEKLVARGKDPIEVKKLFLDEISDIYLTRMQSHYKLMYDSAVFGDMAKKFGTQYGGAELKRKTVDGMDHFLRSGKPGEIVADHSLVVSQSELKNGLKTVSEETKAKYLKAYGLEQKDLDKLGNSFIRVDKETADMINKHGIVKVNQIPDVVLNKAEKLAHVQMAKDTNGLLGAYDKFLTGYKKMVTVYRPTFHMNNAKGNAFNTYLDVGVKAFSPRLQKAGIEMSYQMTMKKAIEGSVMINGVDMPYSTILREMEIQGKIGGGFFHHDVAKSVQKDIADKASETLTKSVLDIPYKLGSGIEDQGRIVNFIANLDAGRSFTEAGEHVDKYLFNYDDLTKFEVETMKRIIPFYTWMRKNIPLQLESMLNNPKRYMPIAKALDEMKGLVDPNQRIDNSKVPAFARDWIQLPYNIINAQTGNKEAVMWSNNLPYLDINKIPDIFNMKDSMTNLFESSSPAIRMPIELGTNTNYFYNSPIAKDKKVVDPSGKFEVSPQLAYVLSQIPQYADVSAITRKSGIDQLIGIMDKGFGSGIKSYDTADDMSTNYDAVQNSNAFNANALAEKQASTPVTPSFKAPTTSVSGVVGTDATIQDKVKVKNASFK